MATKVGSLETEVLAMIIELIDDSSPKTTRAVALVNKHFYSTSRLVAHRRKSITFNRRAKDFQATVDKWLRDGQIVYGLRHLTVVDEEEAEKAPEPADLSESEDLFDENDSAEAVAGDSVGGISSENDFTDNYAALATLVSKLGNLRLLTWDTAYCISTPILESLQKHHRKARLRIFNWHHKPGNAFGDFESAAVTLATYPALSSLKCKIIRSWADFDSDLREATFRRIIATAPNLKYACIIAINGLEGGRGLTAAEAPWLERSYNEFYKHQSPNPAIRTLTLDGFSTSKSTLDDWGRFVDLRQLENFKCTRGPVDTTYFRVAPQLLTNLKHVSLNLAYNHRPDFPAAVQEFIRTVNPLESLSLWSWSRAVELDIILRRHGSSLKALQLHERESAVVSVKRRVLSLAEITAIREKCPSLEDLTIDIDRRDVDLNPERERRNVEIYNELGKFGAQLKKVQMYFDLGLASLSGVLPDPVSSDEEEAGGSDLEDIPPGEQLQPSRSRLHRLLTLGSFSSPPPPPSSSSSPPQQLRQRKRRKLIQPSTQETLRVYLAFVWRTIFGSRCRNTGPMQLDVKVGEWERKFGGAYGAADWLGEEEGRKTLWFVRAGERDDGADTRGKGEELGCTVEGMGSRGLAW